MTDCDDPVTTLEQHRFADDSVASAPNNAVRQALVRGRDAQARHLWARHEARLSTRLSRGDD
jgi:hypothetical protein